MTERAEALTKKLRKEFGNLAPWGTKMTQTCLNENLSEWNIRRLYCQGADDYSKFRTLARSVHRICKKEIGEVPDITEDQIKIWILLDYWTDDQIKVEYQRQFDKAQPNMRRAKKLLVEMRRDHGDCHMVSELRILKWIENGLDEKGVKAIEDKYKGCIREAKVISRAEALQYRLQDELDHRPVASVSELRNRFRENLDDDRIVDYYRERISKPLVAKDAPVAGVVSAGVES